ncbi:MAG: SGNH/GDSL hydrolase family protein [Chloroflexota bacterium]
MSRRWVGVQSEWTARNGAGIIARRSRMQGMRLMAAMITALLCLGLLSPLLPGELVRSVSAADGLPPAPMPVISRGVPAYASSDRGRPASHANDNEYATYWRSSSVPAWLAYDLSGVPAGQRGNVLLAWYNDPITPDYNYALTGNLSYNLPSAYTIEGNAAAGGQVPGSGWKVLATVVGNTYHSRQHAINLAGYNWVRINVSAVSGSNLNRDVALNMDIHDASQGVQDSWIFYGDYIAAGGMDHDSRGIGTFAQLINSSRPQYYPAQESGGTSFVQSGDGARLIRDWLAIFPGRFVVLSFGTTDADFFEAGKPELPDDFYKNYDIMVKAVLEAGKIPIVPKIPYGRTEKIQANGPVLNAQIDRLYAAYPQIVRGPDFWSYFGAHQDQIAADNLNLTASGLSEYRRVWAAEMSERVYGPAGAQPTPPPNPTPGGPCAGHLFPETGKCVGEPFLSYWNTHGGLAINGYPISDQLTETLEDGKPYTVQYFERVRMELHPENQPPFNVLLGQFGRRIHPADPPVEAKSGAQFFPETGHNLQGGFQAYWTANGGLAQFGYPISEEIIETLEDGKPYTVQYFERARFEFHPENQPPYNVLLGQFGRRILGNR